MLKIMNGLPDNVIGVSAEGKITAQDYETVLIPAIEEKLKTHKKLRMLYYIGEKFTGFSVGAMVDDAKIGIKHLTIFDRIAVVSDHQVLDALTKFFGYVLPTKVNAYKNAELEKAKEWVSED